MAPFRGRTSTQVQRAASTPPKTSPIQIPLRRRPTTIPSLSPTSHTLSPEMIFEMSPVTNDTPPHSPFSLHHVSPTETFVYSLPSLSSPPTPRHLKNFIEADPLNIRQTSFIMKQCVLDDQDIVPESPTRQPSTTRITGFRPLRDLQDENQRLPCLERLSPGPRSSHNASPWIISGHGSGPEEDIAYSQADPSAFDYERQLLRRIQNQSRLRFPGGMRSVYAWSTKARGASKSHDGLLLLSYPCSLT